MDRLDAMALFVAAVDAGSLAAAARRLGRSPASVTRAVSMLEGRLGERLLHRSTRRLRLTESGERLLAVYRHVLAELGEAERPDAEGAGIEGRISVTAPELLGRTTLLPILEAFLAAHPGVRARVLLLNRLVNLVEEGVDAALRLAALPDSGLVAARLGEMRSLVCAAPDYLARAGAPAVPADLRRHACLGAEGGDGRETWAFVDRSGGRPRGLSIPVTPRLALNSVSAAIDAAVRGGGVCRVMAYQVVDDIAAGRLVPLLPGYEPEPTPVHLVFPPIPRRNAALRAFVDHATPRLREVIASVAQRTARFATLQAEGRG